MLQYNAVMKVTNEKKGIFSFYSHNMNCTLFFVKFSTGFDTLVSPIIADFQNEAACLCVEGQLQRFYKLKSCERAFKMLKNDMCITEIGQAVLEL